MLLELLKTRTRTNHERLERDLDISAHLADRDSYIRLLARFYGWYQPWESTVRHFPDTSVAAFMSYRFKTDLLRDDLHMLGVDTSIISNLPLASPPKYKSASELLGACYVLEGSTLGAQIISRMIAQKLGFRTGSGSSFYAAYGTSTGERWKEFKQFLELHPGANDVDAVTNSADQTFELIRTWLCEQT